MPPAASLRPVVSLLTDFGLQDAYVGIMKAVLLSRCRCAQLVDLCHAVPPQQILPGALLLRSAVAYFPAGTVHLGVVDPGVGTARRPIVVATENALFVGPDNGLLVPAARSLGDIEVHRIDNSDIIGTAISNTFHGRDVFAPVAGALAAGLDYRDVGPAVSDVVELDLPAASVTPKRTDGRVLYVDGFGNAITNIPGPAAADMIGSGGILRAGATSLRALHASYGSVPSGAPVLVVSSWGTLEIAINDGNAAQVLDLNVGDAVTIEVE